VESRRGLILMFEPWQVHGMPGADAQTPGEDSSGLLGAPSPHHAFGRSAGGSRRNVL